LQAAGLETENPAQGLRKTREHARLDRRAFVEAQPLSDTTRSKGQDLDSARHDIDEPALAYPVLREPADPLADVADTGVRGSVT
jgi:hypothetical protein